MDNHVIGDSIMVGTVTGDSVMIPVKKHDEI